MSNLLLRLLRLLLPLHLVQPAGIASGNGRVTFMSSSISNGKEGNGVGSASESNTFGNGMLGGGIDGTRRSSSGTETRRSITATNHGIDFEDRLQSLRLTSRSGGHNRPRSGL